MADVFLSYSSKDRPAADKLRRVLAARGVKIFPSQVASTDDEDARIRKTLTSAKVVVVLWSRSSVESPNVRHEATLARDADKLAPATLDLLAPDDFPQGLYMAHAVDLHDWRNDASPGFIRIAQEVEARLNKRPSPSGARPNNGSGALTLLAGAMSAIVIVGGAGAAWWVLANQPETSASAAAPASVAASPAAAVGSRAPVGDGLSARIQGYWRKSPGAPCSTQLTLNSGKLMFSETTVRSVQVIDEETSLRIRSHALEPASEARDTYDISIEPFATSAERNFNLIVLNSSKGRREVWSPCEPTKEGSEGGTSPSAAPANQPPRIAEASQSPADQRSAVLRLPPSIALTASAAETEALHKASRTFAGEWRLAFGGGCGNLPWRFKQSGDALVQVFADGLESHPFQMSASAPPTAVNDSGAKRVVEGDLMKVYASGGVLECTLKRTRRVVADVPPQNVPKDLLPQAN